MSRATHKFQCRSCQGDTVQSVGFVYSISFFVFVIRATAASQACSLMKGGCLLPTPNLFRRGGVHYWCKGCQQLVYGLCFQEQINTYVAPADGLYELRSDIGRSIVVLRVFLQAQALHKLSTPLAPLLYPA